MRAWTHGLTVLMLVSIAACGGASKQEQAAKELEQSSKSVATGAQQLASAMEAAAKGMEAASTSEKPVEPISFTAMQPLFPDLSGWTKGAPTGEKMTMPVPFSQASVTYTKDDATIEMKIMDSGFNRALTAPFTMALMAGYERQTENGFEKSAKVGGFPGWETWNGGSKDGQLNVFVGKRFLVTVEGRNIADNKVLFGAAEKMDLNKVASLK